jgi:hypothetical protein
MNDYEKLVRQLEIIEKQINYFKNKIIDLQTCYLTGEIRDSSERIIAQHFRTIAYLEKVYKNLRIKS